MKRDPDELWTPCGGGLIAAATFGGLRPEIRKGRASIERRVRGKGPSQPRQLESGAAAFLA